MRVLQLSLAVFVLACSDGPASSTMGAGGGGGATATSTVTTDSTTGVTSGAGGASGCVNPWDCANNMFCEAPGDACPSENAPGECVPKPSDCTGEPETITCGCNDQIYVSACEASRARRDIGSQAGCVAPADPFACGVVLCQHGVEFCQRINGDPTCKPLPTGCELPGAMCDCVEPAFCVSAPGETQCMKDGGGDFFVDCTVTE